MARARPAHRLDQLVAAAADVFTARGYRRTQMADVARAMGVAPGTLYLYVESKEALFDFVVQRAFAPAADTEPPSLPIATPAPGHSIESLRRRVARDGAMPHLAEALRRRRPPADVAAELAGIVRELYRTLSRTRRAVKLVERSALDWPELAGVWYGEIRRGIVESLTRYLTRRTREKRLRLVPNADAAARLVLETTAWFALHRHGDLEPPDIDEATAEATVVDFIVAALARGRKT